MKNRWIVLAAACVLQTILGGIYAWSIFVPYLMRDYKLSSGECGFIFGFSILSFTVTMLFSGRVIALRGTRFCAAIATLLFTAGYLLASFSNGSFALLWLGIGVVAGVGIGFGYVCPLTVGMKWFPDNKGLVTGVAVAGFGGGAVLLTTIAEAALSRSVNVLVFFRWFALCSGLILLIAAALLSEPDVNDEEIRAFNLRTAILSPGFALILPGMFAGTFAGLLIIGNLTPLTLRAGLSESAATVAVSIFAIGNALGRVVWGWLSDQIAYRSIYLSLVIFAAVTTLLLFTLPMWLHISVAGMLGFSFGSNFVIYASYISRYFGVTAFTQLYPLCFQSYGVAGLIAPGVGGWLADLTNSYSSALTLCIALLLCAALFIFFNFENKVKGKI